MYLSRVELDEARRTTMEALVNPEKLHGAVEAAFLGERRRRLWRLDRLGGKLYLLLLSEDKPELSDFMKQFGGPCTGPAEVRDYSPLLQRVVSGEQWQFRLTANPTKSCRNRQNENARGTVHAHCTVEYQKQWLLQKAEKCGFFVQPENFTVTSARWLRFFKGENRRQPVTLLSVTYEGVLEVTDAQAFCKALINGIGRGKAYGLGLMTILRKRR